MMNSTTFRAKYVFEAEHSHVSCFSIVQSPVPHKSEETPNAEQAAFDDTV